MTRPDLAPLFDRLDLIEIAIAIHLAGLQEALAKAQALGRELRAACEDNS